ncbi:Beta-glucosidase 47, partial [Mucuna pruriens]
MNAVWFEPFSNSSQDKFLDPIILGEYPAEMHEILGQDLPEFSRHDVEKLKTGLDFIGVNHYTSAFVKDCIFSACEPGRGSSRTEGFALTSPQMNGISIGQPTSLDWLYVHPQGMEKMVTYIKHRYNNIPMFVTENGLGTREYSNPATEEIINDVERVEYLRGYLDSLAEAISKQLNRKLHRDHPFWLLQFCMYRKGADVRGYFVWSLLDNFEWTDGLSIRFGLHHVDYATLDRTPRLSAFWYKNFIALHADRAGIRRPRNGQE